MNFKYKRGDVVYLKTDSDQMKRMVIGYEIRDTVRYILVCEVMETFHEEMEISDEKDVMMM
jgi:hypothetical protein